MASSIIVTVESEDVTYEKMRVRSFNIMCVDADLEGGAGRTCSCIVS